MIPPTALREHLEALRTPPGPDDYCMVCGELWPCPTALAAEPPALDVETVAAIVRTVEAIRPDIEALGMTPPTPATAPREAE